MVYLKRMSDSDRVLIYKSAQSVLEVLAYTFEQTWNASPLAIQVQPEPVHGKASLEFLHNLGLVELSTPGLRHPKSAYVFDNTKLLLREDSLSWAVRVDGTYPILQTVGLTPKVQARIVQEGAEGYLRSADYLRVKVPGLFNQIEVVAPMPIHIVDELLEQAPTGEILVLNADSYAEIRMCNREVLHLVKDMVVLEKGIQATYRSLVIKVTRACSPEEVFLLDGRGTVVASLKVIRY